MAIDWILLEQQGIRRTGNKGVGSPHAFVIVGIDIGVDDLLAKFDGDGESQDVIRKGAQDAARLKDPIPGWFRRNLRRGKPKAIVVYQLLERNRRGEVVKSWPVVIDGRTRTLVMREHVNGGKTDAEKNREVEAEIKSYKKEDGAGMWALREKARANHFVPETLFVKAERAFDFHEDGVALVQIADEIGMDFGDPETEEGRAEIEKGIRALLRWHEIKNDLCVEAQQRATRGALKLGAAVRLAGIGKREQEERLLYGKVKAKRGTPGRPLSPRTLDIFIEQVTAHADRGTLALLRLARGDTGAAKDLPDELRAGWLRAQEAAKKKPRVK